MLQKFWVVAGIALFGGLLLSAVPTVRAEEAIPMTALDGLHFDTVTAELDALQLTESGDGSVYTLAFKLKNTHSEKQSFRFGIEFHEQGEKNGQQPFIVRPSETYALASNEVRDIEFSFPKPVFLAGKYLVLLGIGDELGDTVTLGTVSEVDFGVREGAALTQCTAAGLSNEERLVLSVQEAVSRVKVACQGNALNQTTESAKVVARLVQNRYGAVKEIPVEQVTVSDVSVAAELVFAQPIDPGTYRLEIGMVDGAGKDRVVPAMKTLVVQGTGGRIVSMANVSTTTFKQGDVIRLVAALETYDKERYRLAFTLSAGAVQCADPISVDVAGDNIKGVDLTLKTECPHPTAMAILTANDGKELDRMTRVLVVPATGSPEGVTPSESGFTMTKKSAWLLMAILGLLLGYLIFKKGTMKRTMPMIFALALSSAAFVLSAPSAQGASFDLFCNGSVQPCSSASAVFINVNATKNIYAPGESIDVRIHLSSDDAPLASTCPNVQVNGGPNLASGCYSRASLAALVTINASAVATAPMTSGPFTINVRVGATGYITPANQNISLTVSAPAPTVTVNPFNPSTITAGQASNISFSSTNATSCTGSGIWNGPIGTSNPGISTGPMSAGTYTQYVTCTGPGGSSPAASQTLIVNPAPVVTASFTSTPSCVIAAGEPGCMTTLSWTASNVSTIVLTDCRSESLPDNDRLLTTTTSSGPGSFNPVYVPYNSGCYRIHESSVTGRILDQRRVSSSCAAGTSWSGIVDASGNPMSLGICQGAAPTATISITGAVAYEPEHWWQKALSWVTGWDQVAQANHGDAAIIVGENIRLNWSSTNATRCFIDNGIGDVAPNVAGNQRIAGLPAGVRTYTIACQNSSGVTATHSAMVTVNPARADGVCAATHNNCTSGVSRDDTDGPTEYRWTCMGVGGGFNSPQCTEPMSGGGAICGNGIVEGGEQCDTGNARGACPATCSNACSTNNCGGGGAPSTPSGLSVTPGACGSNRLTISWNAVAGVLGYELYADGDATPIYSGLGTSYSHNSLIPGDTHSYRVLAYNANGDSPQSGAATGTVPAATCSSLGGPTMSVFNLTCGSNGLSNVRANWSDIVGATSYRLQIDGTTAYEGPNSFFNHMNLVNGSTHTYRARALSSSGSSPYSNLVTHTSPVCSALNVNGCTIPDGSSTCDTSVSWFSSAQFPRVWHEAIRFSSAASGNVTRTLQYGSNTFTLYHSVTTLLDTKVAVASCAAGSSWDGSVCQSGSGSPAVVAVPASCTIPDGQSTCGPLTVNWTNASSPTAIKYTYSNPGPGNAYNGTTTLSNAVNGSASQLIRYGGVNVFWNDTGSGADGVFSATGTCVAGSSWNGTVCQSISGPTGTITSVNPPSCQIAVGDSSCSTLVSWTSNVSAVDVEILLATPASVSGPGIGSQSFAIPYGTHVVTLREAGVDLDTDSVTAVCAAGASWSGSACVTAPTVDLKINGSDGPLSLAAGNMTLSWTTSGASSCTAAGPGWSGAKPTSSVGEVVSAAFGTYTLTCTDGSVDSDDSVDVGLTCASSCTEWSACGPPCAGGEGSQSRTCTSAPVCVPSTVSRDCTTDTCRDLNWKEVGQ